MLIQEIVGRSSHKLWLSVDPDATCIDAGNASGKTRAMQILPVEWDIEVS